MTSTWSSSLKASQSTLSPGLSSSPASMRTSASVRIGATPEASKRPRAGLFARRSGRESTRPIWIASYPSRSAVFFWTTRQGPACRTVTGRAVPSGRKICVIPTFLPMIPCTAMAYFPNALISTSTPTGSSSFIRASTVWEVGSRMSSSRLCVRISNCSRDFLSMWGERLTV